MLNRLKKTTMKRNRFLFVLFLVSVFVVNSCEGLTDTCYTCTQRDNKTNQVTKTATVCSESDKSTWEKNNSGGGYSASCTK